MKFEGSREVEAGSRAVWDFIIVPQNLADCLPDATETQVAEGKTITAKMRVGVGFIKDTFDSRISYRDVNEQNMTVGLAIDAKAKSNSSNVLIDISVSGDDSTATLKWSVDAMMAGRLASIGQRYISKVADRIIERSFECMMAKL